ncbi:hypothetical protein ACFQV4_36020 [Streptomyces thermocarboxydus]
MVYVQNVVGAAGRQRELPHSDAPSGQRVELVAVLDDPARGLEERVDTDAGLYLVERRRALRPLDDRLPGGHGYLAGLPALLLVIGLLCLAQLGNLRLELLQLLGQRGLRLLRAGHQRLGFLPGPALRLQAVLRLAEPDARLGERRPVPVQRLPQCPRLGRVAQVIGNGGRHEGPHGAGAGQRAVEEDTQVPAEPDVGEGGGRVEDVSVHGLVAASAERVERLAHGAVSAPMLVSARRRSIWRVPVTRRPVRRTSSSARTSPNWRALTEAALGLVKTFNSDCEP